MPRTQHSADLEQFWRRHFSQQDGSGLTIRDYCLKHSLSEASFYSWRRIIAERDRQSEPAARPTSAFLPVNVVDAPARRDDPSIEIRLGGGCRVRVRNGCDRALLADVLALLQSQAVKETSSC
jgi:transposase-like protein